MEKLVSIIIPAHNAEKYIKKCVYSIINQSYRNIEIIIVNNASKDNTKEICKDLSDEYNNIKVINIDEAGVSNARNIGLQNANGQIIGFCDADDYMQGDIIEKICSEFLDARISIVVCGYNVVDSNNKILYENLLDKCYLWNNEELASFALLDYRILGSVCNKFFKAEVINDYRFNCQLSMCEDCHFLIKVLMNNIKIKYINVVGYNYVNNKESATNSIDKLFNNVECRYIQAMESIRSECKLTRKLEHDLNAACVKLAFDTYLVLVDNDTFEKQLFNLRKTYLLGYIKKYKLDFIFNSKISFKIKVKSILSICFRRRK